ncbi:NgoMIV family type II restriction endonuclease [Nocardia sp. NPDC020380]|uniref:NgoMIV family type II restriction endonuclease n=1 Tax=Nocardia sp. NPDC020380 TaxID=3364309 RepID=UPI00379E2D45
MTDAPFATKLLGWKSGKKGLLPNTADTSNKPSIAIAAAVLDNLGVPRGIASGIVDPKSGRPLEVAVASDLAAEIPKLSPGRIWMIPKSAKPITNFVQYEHLKRVDLLVNSYEELKAALGTDYIIKPDVVVGLHSGENGDLPFLHAAVSCKWTIRSDRVQNIRHENNQMIRHRRDRLPHLAVVTAEPLPSRLASIARGTGEVDAVYHIAYDALDQAISSLAKSGEITNDQLSDWHEVKVHSRVRPYSDLADTLARW